MTRSRRASIFLLGLLGNQFHFCQSTGPETSGLRAGVKKTDSKSAVRRQYGSHNGEVRKYVRWIEEKSERSRTGVLGDPSHEVPYENHPYQQTLERRKRERNLQDTEYIEPTSSLEEGVVNIFGETTTTTEDLYKPLRIRFETQALDDTRNAGNAAKIDFIKAQILTQTAEYWSQALSVVPVSGNLKISAAELENREFCGDSEFTKVPTEHISTGIPDADLILYVSGTPSSRFCRGTTLAVAVACNFDQYDRPTAGAINVCLDRINLNEDGTASEAIIVDNVDVLKHEVAHVLGHSSNSYRFYWDSETGTERTPRPFQLRTVTCVDDVERELILPSEDTMQFFEGNNGQRYAAIVTPKVRAMARNQFDCQSLPGAKLENQPTGTDSCTGDHWDEHDYYTEALSGVLSPTTNVMSHLTLALFEDSGWYRANYTQGQMNAWGLAAGCDFVEEPCLVEADDGSTLLPDYSKGYFCSDVSQRGCSPTLTHKMACTVVDWFLQLPQILPEKRFQYFKEEIAMGGPRQADYCPLFGSTYGNLEPEQLACGDVSNADALNIYSEVYGQDSQCIPTEGGDGRCYKTACVKDEMVLRINVRGEWLVCEYDFQTLDVRVGAGALPQTLVCPRLSTACPDLFCPFNCAGRGVCNYKAVGVNGTVQPTCECFDKSDTSPGCSNSLLPGGDFLDNADGLLDNIEEDFFDPLVSVFVDHPDKWTSSSWAWGAGLLTIFFLMLLCICSAFWPETTGQGKANDFKKSTKSPGSPSGSPRKSSSDRPRQSSSSGRPRSSSAGPRQSSSTRRPRSSSAGPNRQSSSTRRPRSSSAGPNRQSSSTRRPRSSSTGPNRQSSSSRRPRSSSAGPNRQSSSSRRPRSSSVGPRQSSSSRRNYNSSSQRPDGRYHSSEPLSFHERYLQDNHRVVSKSRSQGSRMYSQNLMEM